MSNFIQVTPFLHVRSMARALDFFVNTLGFRTLYREANYAYVEREGVGFRLLELTREDAEPAAGGRFAYYIDVRDVDALHAQLRAKLDRLPPGDVTGPVNQHYRQRELIVVAPDGNLLVFGQALKGDDAA